MTLKMLCVWSVATRILKWNCNTPPAIDIFIFSKVLWDRIQLEFKMGENKHILIQCFIVLPSNHWYEVPISLFSTSRSFLEWQMQQIMNSGRSGLRVIGFVWSAWGMWSRCRDLPVMWRWMDTGTGLSSCCLWRGWVLVQGITNICEHSK